MCARAVGTSDTGAAFLANAELDSLSAYPPAILLRRVRRLPPYTEDGAGLDDMGNDIVLVGMVIVLE